VAFWAGIFKKSMEARHWGGIGFSYRPARARTFKCLRGPRIDFNESIPPAYVAWIGGTTALILLGSKPP
jgi:hypothetical protein